MQGDTALHAAGWSNRRWPAGFAVTLLGAFGVPGLQDAISFLIASEVMSPAGAGVILGEGLAEAPDRRCTSC
jgi:hypothetical protein